MKRHVMLALAAMSLFLAVTGAHARGLEDVATEVSAAASRDVRMGSSPAEVAAYLRMHNFYPSEYARNYQKMSGYSMYDQDGVFTADPTQAAFAVSMNFQFDERERLKHYEVEVQKVGN